MFKLNLILGLPIWFLLIIFLQLSFSCRSYYSGSQNQNVIGGEKQSEERDSNISVLVDIIRDKRNMRFNKTDGNQVRFHVDDTYMLSCEQTSKKYTLAWTQYADHALISYPPKMAKKVTIHINLHRFDNEAIFKCTAFENVLFKTVSHISLKFVDTEKDSNNKTYSANVMFDPQCPDKALPYVILNDKLYNYNSSMYSNDSTKVCIRNDLSFTNGTDILITRRVTYMNNRKPKIPTADTQNKGPPDDKNNDYKHLWMAVGGTVSALTIFIIIIVIWKRKRKSSPDISSDPIHATAQDLNRVVYADLDMTRGSSFSPNRDEVAPYAQVAGIIKKKKNKN